MVLRDPRMRMVKRRSACVAWRATFVGGAWGATRATRAAAARVEEFFEYVESRRDVWGVTRDVWAQAHLFVCELCARGGELTWYDDAEAWPSLFDEYVDAARGRRGEGGESTYDVGIGSGMMMHHDVIDGGGDFDRGFGEELMISSDAETRKRRNRPLSEDIAEGLSLEFERELDLVIERTPKRVCSEMDLDGHE
jgi:hypothetical protein